MPSKANKTPNDMSQETLNFENAPKPSYSYNFLNIYHRKIGQLILAYFKELLLVL